MNRIPAWFGWPSTGVAPGSDWLPGPLLRFTTLLLLCAFLALGLTVNYVSSCAFFLLAISGMYVGLRRGFLRGLTRAERLLFIAIAAFPIVAIASYLLGTQTNVGFRFLGRDLRFLLFIPIYLVLRWTRPKLWLIGIALAAGVSADLFVALIQYKPLPSLAVQGVTGTHIVFGDLSILSGFLAGMILLHKDTRYAAPELFRRTYAFRGLGLLSIFCGVAGGVLSGARGGWIAIPPLTILVLIMLRPLHRLSKRFWLLTAGFSVVALIALALFVTPIKRRATAAAQDVTSYFTVAKQKAIETPCVDQKFFLHALLARSNVAGSGVVRIRRLPETQRTNIAKFGCRGSYAIVITNPERARREQALSVFRGNGIAKQIKQNFIVIAYGRGEMTVGGEADWIKLNSPAAWKRYQATGNYKWLAFGNLHVRPGASLWIIPMQVPRGFYAYALAKNSVGQRLEMWRAAWRLFLRHPVIGSGVGSFEALGESALGHSALRSIVGKYQHAHNDYLTAAATTGLLGLIALLALWITPLFFARKPAGGGAMGCAQGTLITCITGFTLFGLTETMYIHSLVISWYVITTALILAILNEHNTHDVYIRNERTLSAPKDAQKNIISNLVEKLGPK